MSLSSALKRPFLQVSTKYLWKSRPSLGMYKQKCPVMSKLAGRAAGGGVGAAGGVGARGGSASR